MFVHFIVVAQSVLIGNIGDTELRKAIFFGNRQ